MSTWEGEDIKCILPGKQTETEELQSSIACLSAPAFHHLRGLEAETDSRSLSRFEHTFSIDSQSLLITSATFSSALFTPNTVLSTQHPQA